MKSQRTSLQHVFAILTVVLASAAPLRADSTPAADASGAPAPSASASVAPSPEPSAAPSPETSAAPSPEPSAAPDSAAEAKAPTAGADSSRPNTCAACHKDEAAVYVGSIHEAAGVRCAQCHGGDDTLDKEETSMAKSKGFIRKLKRDKKLIFQVCAQCHKATAGSDKKGPGDLYPLSFHAKKVLQEGDFAAAVCTDCHGTHDILPRTDPRSRTHRLKIPESCDKCHGDDARMNPYGIPTDQFKKYKVSHHGKAVLQKKNPEAAVCTDCHRSHDVLPPDDPKSPIFRVNVPDTCGRCHGDATLMEKHNLQATATEAYRTSVHGEAVLKKGSTTAPTCVTCHGNHTAVPPGFRHVAAVCGRCHVNTEEAFAKSPHAKLKFKGCVECHSNHGIQHPSAELFNNACVKCHPVGSPGYERGQQLKALETNALASLEKTKRDLDELRAHGYAQDKLKEKLAAARQEYLQMAPALHTLSVTETRVQYEKVVALNGEVRKGIDELELQAGLRRWSLVLVIGVFLFAARLFLQLSRAYHAELDAEHSDTPPRS